MEIGARLQGCCFQGGASQLLQEAFESLERMRGIEQHIPRSVAIIELPSRPSEERSVANVKLTTPDPVPNDNRGCIIRTDTYMGVSQQTQF